MNTSQEINASQQNNALENQELTEREKQGNMRDENQAIVRESQQETGEHDKGMIESKLEEVKNAFDQAHEREVDTLSRVKKAFTEKFPGSNTPSAVSGILVSANEVKSRLNWGEPGLTILDIRDRDSFDDCRILGAINVQLDKLPEAIQPTIYSKRDIYIYGHNDDEAVEAVNKLRKGGFRHVAAMRGGLHAWQEIRGSVDGVETNQEPSLGAYNIFSRLKEFAQEQAREKTV